jgi:hypothetical protein
MAASIYCWLLMNFVPTNEMTKGENFCPPRQPPYPLPGPGKSSQHAKSKTIISAQQYQCQPYT